jgi:hypothetical protein
MGNSVEVAVSDVMPSIYATLGIVTPDAAVASQLYELLVKFYTDAYVDGRNETI